MSEREREDLVEIGVFNSKRSDDIYTREFVCTAAGKVEGDLDAEVAEVNGACKFEGRVKASLFKVRGSVKIEGDIYSELLRIKGATKAEKDVHVENLVVEGVCKIEGNLNCAERTDVKGVLNVEGDMNADKVTWTGQIEVEGTLRANEIIAELSGKSKFADIIADKIDVRVSKFASKKSKFTARKITGDQIYLENTTADVVEGSRVELGPGCKIGEVVRK